MTTKRTLHTIKSLAIDLADLRKFVEGARHHRITALEDRVYAIEDAKEEQKPVPGVVTAQLLARVEELEQRLAAKDSEIERLKTQSRDRQVMLDTDHLVIRELRQIIVEGLKQ